MSFPTVNRIAFTLLLTSGLHRC